MSFIYQIFLKGLLTLLPISLTVALLVWIVRQTEVVFAEPLRQQFPELFAFPGAGLVFALLLIFTVGLLLNTYLTRRFVRWLEKRLETLPIVRAIYSPIRDVTNLFADSESRGAAQRVVMVQIGNGGLEAMGLVTRDSFGDLPSGTVNAGSVTVFIPFSYGMGGFTVAVPRERVRETQLTAERAMQLAITGWIKASK